MLADELTLEMTVGQLLMAECDRAAPQKKKQQA